MDEVETLMYSKAEGPPWHGIGTEVPEAATSEVALGAAGLDWIVVQRPVFLFSPEGVGHWVKGLVANVRELDGKVLGVVRERYRVIQNREAFAFVDTLLEQATGAKPRYTTAGSLRGGQRVFLCALLPEEVKLVGDPVQLYLVFSNGHDGHAGVRVMVTPVRVVCMNTLNLTLRKARRSWSTVHIGDPQWRMWQIQESLGLARRYTQALSEEAERLAETRISLEEYVDRLIPLAPKAPEHVRRRQLVRRVALFERAAADDLKSYQGTAWALINGVADFVAHVRASRVPTFYAERLAEKVMDGHPLLDRVYGMVTARDL